MRFQALAKTDQRAVSDVQCEVSPSSGKQIETDDRVREQRVRIQAFG
jgi:hypothetical protein